MMPSQAIAVAQGHDAGVVGCSASVSGERCDTSDHRRMRLAECGQAKRYGVPLACRISGTRLDRGNTPPSLIRAQQVLNGVLTDSVGHHLGTLLGEIFGTPQRTRDLPQIASVAQSAGKQACEAHTERVTPIDAGCSTPRCRRRFLPYSAVDTSPWLCGSIRRVRADTASHRLIDGRHWQIAMRSYSRACTCPSRSSQLANRIGNRYAEGASQFTPAVSRSGRGGTRAAAFMCSF